MEHLSIVTSTDSVFNRVYNELEQSIGPHVKLKRGRDEINLLWEGDDPKDRLADTLSHVILEEYERKLICRLIAQNYCYFTKKEQRGIYQCALKYVQPGQQRIGSHMRNNRSRLISNRLKEYLKTSDAIVLDGFITFRLADYQRELEELLERAVDDFLVEKEYYEFIRLLKSFIALQTPKYHTVHIVATSQNFELYNREHRDITAECIEEFINYENDVLLRSEDLLISSLISIAPQAIYIHNRDLFDNEQLLQTILMVFGKRVQFCSGCGLCGDGEPSITH